MIKAKNVEAVKELISVYNSITVEQIIPVWNSPTIKIDNYSTIANEVANKLTGYGSSTTCRLCKDVECDECLHRLADTSGCSSDSSYFAIYASDSPIKLNAAFKARAYYLRNLLSKYENKLLHEPIDEEEQSSTKRARAIHHGKR